MAVNITGRHYDISDSLKEAVNERVDNLEKFMDGIITADVIFSKQKAGVSVEVAVVTKGGKIVAHADEDNVRKSLDSAFDKATKQLKKINEKMKNHRIKKVDPSEDY